MGTHPKLAKVSWNLIMKYGHNSHSRVEAERYCPQEPTYGTTFSWWLTLRIEISPPPFFEQSGNHKRKLKVQLWTGLHIEKIDRLFEDGGTKVTSSTFSFHFSMQTCHKVHGCYSITLLYRTPCIWLVCEMKVRKTNTIKEHVFKKLDLCLPISITQYWTQVGGRHLYSIQKSTNMHF